MENVFDLTIFCDNILFLRRYAGSGRIWFARLLSIDLHTLISIERKTDFLPIDPAMLFRLRLLLGESARDIFFRRFNEIIEKDFKRG